MKVSLAFQKFESILYRGSITVKKILSTIFILTYGFLSYVSMADENGNNQKVRDCIVFELKKNYSYLHGEVFDLKKNDLRVIIKVGGIYYRLYDDEYVQLNTIADGSQSICLSERGVVSPTIYRFVLLGKRAVMSDSSGSYVGNYKILKYNDLPKLVLRKPIEMSPGKTMIGDQ